MQGKLLIAHPLLNDSFFNRSVIYLTDYSKEGAIGFSLNFKTEFNLSDIKPNIKNGHFPIYEGGPVAKNELFFLHTLGSKISNASKINNYFFIGGDFNELTFLIEKGKVKPNQIRFFAGYSGWDENQLDQEIKKNHWLINAPSSAAFFGNATEDLWKLQLTEIKKTYGIFGDFGFDPYMN